MNMETPSRLLFKDPLRILMAKEARTCKGCIHQHSDYAFGIEVVVCKKIDEKGRNRRHGRRCKDYKENNGF